MSFGLKEIVNVADTSLDGKIIPNYVTGLQQGVPIPKDYTKDTIQVGTPVYYEGGKFKFVAVKNATTFDELPEGAVLVGVTVCTCLKSDEVVGVMDMGVVCTLEMPIKYSDTLLKALSDNLKISFRKWL